MKDAENNLTTYEYDGHDRLSKTRMPSTTKGSGTSSATDFEQLTYENTAGNTRTSATVASVRLRDAQVIAFGYDGLTRRVSKDLPGGEWDETYNYDNLGRMTGAVKGPITHSFGYDALSRQISEGQIYGSVTRQFDLAGRMTRTSWWDGFYVDYQRHVTGELMAVRENGAVTGPGVLASYFYDDLRRRTSLWRGNGAVTYWAYDPVSRLASMTHDLTGTADDLTQTFSYNPAQQMTQVVRSNDAYAWTGHGSGTTASVADGLNRLITIGGVGATSDARGNMTSDPTTGRTFGYFSQNDLRSSGTFGIGYDALLRPIDTLNSGSVTKQFTYDGIQIVAASNPGAGIAERYVWADGPDELLVDYAGSGTANRRWAHQDERGSVIALSDASGTASVRNKYDEFGKPQSGNAGRFQYTGQMWMPEISLYHYKSRVYSPTFGGRFLQTDPIGYAGGINLYAYVGNDPVNFTDPLGLLCPDGSQGCPVQGPDIIVTGSGIQCPPGWYMIFGSCFENAFDWWRRQSGIQDTSGANFWQASAPGHTYPGSGRLCTARPGRPCRIERVNSEMCVLPGGTSKDPIVSGGLYGVTPDYGFPIPIGFVRTVMTGPYSFRNTTTWAHPFAGSVDITFTQDRSGNVDYRLVGQGTSIFKDLDKLNERIGPFIFEDQMSLCAAYVGGK